MDDQKKLRVVPNPHVDLNNARNLRSIFPRGSKSFFEANETKTIPKLPHPDSKHYEATPLDRVAKRKEESLGRITLCYRLRRVRPLDPDNAQGSTKDLTDGLCRCGLLPGDNPTQITLIVEQERVARYSEEGTEIELTYPD
jgi:hypothetical protein